MGKENLWELLIKSFKYFLNEFPFHGIIAPSNIDKFLFGTTRSKSIPIISPYPWQVLHAPYGLLKLKNCSLGSEKKIPSLSKLFENEILLLLSRFIILQIPFPSKKAISID